MKHLRQKFVLLLADPETNRSDLLSFCEWLRKGGLRTCVAQAEKIRALLSQPGGEASDKSLERMSDEASARYVEVVDSITRLLIGEAKLRRREALLLLAERLGYRRGFSARISFDRGLLRLLTFANPPTVLSAAQKIRNEVVHDHGALPWPLREQSDEASQ